MLLCRLWSKKVSKIPEVECTAQSSVFVDGCRREEDSAGSKAEDIPRRSVVVEGKKAQLARNAVDIGTR